MEQEKTLEEKTSAAKSLEELDKIEQEINDKGGQPQPKDPDTKETDDPDKEPEPKKDDKDKKPDDKEPGDKTEKTVITDELRKKLNIPDKFKYMEDVVVWGAESEKLITKAANEKKEILKEKEQAVSEREVYKQEIAKLKEELKKANDKEPTISKEEKQKMIDEFNELFVEDPIKAITKVMQKVNEIKKDSEPDKEPEPKKDDKEQEKIEKVRKEFHERATKEWEDISKDLDDTQKKELLVELNKIAQEKPYIISLYDLKDIYDIRKQKEEIKLKQEEEKKKKERASQSSPQSTAEVVREDKIKTINSAKSLKDLDEAEKRL